MRNKAKDLPYIFEELKEDYTRLVKAIEENYGPKSIEDYLDNWPT